MIIILVTRENRKRKLLLLRLLQPIGGEEEMGNPIIRHAGHVFKFDYSQGNNNAPNGLVVTIECPSDARFNLMKNPMSAAALEKMPAFARKLIEWLPIRGLKTGDPNFDEQFLIRIMMGKKDFVHALFCDERNKNAVCELFKKGATALIHDGKSLRIFWRQFKLDESSDISFITPALPEITVLAENFSMPQKEYIRQTYQPKPAPQILTPIRRIFIFISLPIVFLSAVLPYSPVDAASFDAYMKNYLYAAGAILTVIFFWGDIRRIFQHHEYEEQSYQPNYENEFQTGANLFSNIHPNLIRAFHLILIWFIVLWGGRGVARFLNGALDRGPIQTRVINNFGVIEEKGLFKSHFLTVESWHKTGAMLTIKIHERKYNRIKSGGIAAVKIETCSGRFGFESINSVNLVPKYEK